MPEEGVYDYVPKILQAEVNIALTLLCKSNVQVLWVYL
jgi:hypothetical protein